MSDLCKFCNLPITAKYRKWKACEPCGRKAKNAYQNARRAAERRCKAEGCESNVATPYARYCAKHALAARLANVARARAMTLPVVGKQARAKRYLEAPGKPQVVIVPPGVRVTRCKGVPASFRDWCGEG